MAHRKHLIRFIVRRTDAEINCKLNGVQEEGQVQRKLPPGQCKRLVGCSRVTAICFNSTSTSGTIFGLFGMHCHLSSKRSRDPNNRPCQYYTNYSTFMGIPQNMTIFPITSSKGTFLCTRVPRNGSDKI